LWVKTDHFHALTGFKPSFTFEEGMSETIAYYKKEMQKKKLIEEIKINNWEK
jgi:UDP-glucose 4-epimerase